MKSNLPFYLSFFVVAILGSFTACGQSIVPIDPPAVVYGTPSDNLITVNFDVRNASDSPISTFVKRVQTNVVPGTANYFCWFQCYSPSTDVAPTPLTIAAGDTVSNFYADYQPNGHAGSSFIDYCFYAENDSTDMTCVTVEFRIGTNSVNETQAIKIGNPQPNPAVDRTIIPFDLRENNQDAALVVYNILGSEIKRVPVIGTSGNIDLNVSDLQSGVYIYSFYNSNRLLASSRLIVR